MAKIKVVIVALVEEDKPDDEQFGDFIKRMRLKYSNKTNAKRILLLAV